MNLKKALTCMVLVGFLSSACASLSLHDAAGQAIATAETALHIVTDAELALVCGTPTSLPGHCITAEQHVVFKQKLLDAFALLKDAKDIYVLLPTTGTPNVSAITQIIAKIGAIIQEIENGFPDTTSKAQVAAAPSVIKTVAVK